MSEVYLAHSSQIAARSLGGEMVIMSVKDSTFFTLNNVATVIWEAADGRTPLSSIVENIVCSQFDVDRETALNDAQQLVSDLSLHGILKVSDSPIHSVSEDIS